MLSPEQLAARVGKLTASRMACLMRADKAAILQLYKEMIGEGEPEDLSHVWPVQLGNATEQLNLAWFERKHGALTRRGEVAVHPRLPWAAATLDAFCPSLACPVECKHVGGREPLETIIERYQPQCQWQMEVTGAKECALSVIQGADEPIVEFIPRDEEYAAEMIKRGEQFMTCVNLLIMPVAMDPIAPPVEATKIIDMTGNNAWANEAGIWLTNKDAADRADIAEKALKELMPADARICVGYGVRITRDRVGRKRLRENDQ